MDVDEVIEALRLEPHPEGGWYRETWREEAGTAIYFLLRAGERAHWHRVHATEVWHFYAGDALRLTVSPDGVSTTDHLLGLDLAGGAAPHRVVPARAWQSARPLGSWALVGCTVSPAFQFSGFELAPPGWEPGAGPP